MDGWVAGSGKMNARKVTFNWCVKGRDVSRGPYSSGGNWQSRRAEWTNTRWNVSMIHRRALTDGHRAEVMDGGE